MISVSVCLSLFWDPHHSLGQCLALSALCYVNGYLIVYFWLWNICLPTENIGGLWSTTSLVVPK
jgi:hypothetical protein